MVEATLETPRDKLTFEQRAILFLRATWRTMEQQSRLHLLLLDLFTSPLQRRVDRMPAFHGCEPSLVVVAPAVARRQIVALLF